MSKIILDITHFLWVIVFAWYIFLFFQTFSHYISGVTLVNKFKSYSLCQNIQSSFYDISTVVMYFIPTFLVFINLSPLFLSHSQLGSFSFLIDLSPSLITSLPEKYFLGFPEGNVWLWRTPLTSYVKMYFILIFERHFLIYIYLFMFLSIYLYFSIGSYFFLSTLKVMIWLLACRSLVIGSALSFVFGDPRVHLGSWEVDFFVIYPAGHMLGVLNLWIGLLTNLENL